MNFTREPIIETIVSSKDGYKLVVRNSKGVGQEEYLVDALEVVSFGNAFFFRSLDRPKSFLVPVSDYEVLEVRETRVSLKHVAIEKSIKIAGGREASLRTSREVSPAAPEKKSPETNPEEPSSRNEKKRERRRYRRRRNREEKEESKSEEALSLEGEGEEEKDSSVGFGSLLPPPPTLISENISKYKEQFGIKDDLPSFEDDDLQFDEVCETREFFADEDNEVCTEVLSNDHERDLISDEQFLGDHTGQEATEVFPHGGENPEQEGLLFPSIWMPKEDDSEHDTEAPQPES